MATLDLTPEATNGYRAPPDAECPHYASSPASLAWFVGRWLQQTGRCEPRNVRPSRGHRIRANDMLLLVDSRGNVTRVE